MARREFTRNQREQIVERSKNDLGQICCERCKLVLAGKPYEIDHILAEALRPEADKQRKITIAEGQLLGKDCCHRGKDGKTNQDVKAIAKAKRVYNGANGLKASKQKIRSPGFPKALKSLSREPKPTLAPRPLYTESK
ncbi:hypothetical protein ATY75_11960 [Rhizobium sp. N122]|uniref:hypothetical protein n=1 Tax=Rhizobium sp. N122 TaxID=1764272 RepID=UPI000B5A51EF|nr:hypothetical protein [Rhizobium sp. N122]OWV62535.1 hypothetical protein ATY75_11960 [Rhizobium sp. N122]